MAIDAFIHRNQNPPTRDQAAMLQAFAKNPRLFAIADRVADGVATPEWRAYQIPSGARGVYSELRMASEQTRAEIKQDLKEVSRSDALDLWNRSSPDLTSHQIRRLMQLHLDLAGESYSLIEPNGLGLPAFLYPIPPTWVTPPSGRFSVDGIKRYSISGGGFLRENITADKMFAIRKANPADPYGRGVGIGTALSNEVDTDEYAARMTAAKFYNGGMPDWLIRLEGLGENEIKQFKQDFVDRFRGPQSAGKIHFSNAKALDAQKLDASFVDLDVVELRRFAAEVIRECFGVPPEIMGNVTNSNRATISAAYYLFTTLCLVPRLRVLEDAVNQCLIPLMGESGILISYDSPVPADEEAERGVKLALPSVFTVNEIRCAGGEEPRDDGDELYIDTSAFDAPAGGDGAEDSAADDAETDDKPDSPESTETPEPKQKDQAVTDPNKKDPAASVNSLNGAQVTSAKEIVLDVAYGRLPRESGLAMLQSFFGLTLDQAEQVMGAVGKTFKPQPEDGAAPAADAKP